MLLRFTAGLLLCTLALPALRASQTSSSVGALRSLPALVDRFLQGDAPPLLTYRARRYMRAQNTRFNAVAQLEAITELGADGAFRYDIVTQSGTGYLRERVLEAVLREEAALWRIGAATRGGLTPANYVFAMSTIEDSGLAEERVEIRPRRKDTLLVDGALFLSAPDGDLRRIEGRLSKNPSFWTSHVDVVRRYERVGGVRVPVATTSVASVKLAGRSTFEMTYEYESINGHPVLDEASAESALLPAGGSRAGTPSEADEHVARGGTGLRAYQRRKPE